MRNRFLLFALSALVPGSLQRFGDAGRAQPAGAEAADAGFAGGDGEFVGTKDTEQGAGWVIGVRARVGILGLGAWLVGRGCCGLGMVGGE